MAADQAQQAAAQGTGILSLVGTPIGNLSDASPRVLDTLCAADVLLCEDTRVTSKLLARFDIHVPLERCDENVIASRVSAVLERVAAGQRVAFVSDAGMPGVSDPGQKLVDAALDEGLPVEVIPGPSAVVIDCAGALDDILLLGDPSSDCQLVCEAGATLKDASDLAASLGLAGLEFACGIPGSVGGAVFMNAGAYDGCIADVLQSATCLMPGGEVQEIEAADLAFGYRTSRVRTDNLVVLAATFKLHPGDKAAIETRVSELTEARESKQPLDLPSAGSTFKRPEGYFAGKLITDAGLKGYELGGAAVSAKHAGFVVNAHNATAADVLALIKHVQSEVKRQFGVELEPEVRMVGEF